MKETHDEIIRLDAEVKDVYRLTREREERKDRLIDDLKAQIKSLEADLAESIVTQQKERERRSEERLASATLTVMMNSMRANSRSVEKRQFEETNLFVGGQSLARALDFRDIKAPLFSQRPPEHSFRASNVPDTKSQIQEDYNQRLLRSLEKKARNRLFKEDDGRLRATQQLKELSSLFRRKPHLRTPSHPAPANIFN